MAFDLLRKPAMTDLYDFYMKKSITGGVEPNIAIR